MNLGSYLANPMYRHSSQEVMIPSVYFINLLKVRPQILSAHEEAKDTRAKFKAKVIHGINRRWRAT